MRVYLCVVIAFFSGIFVSEITHSFPVYDYISTSKVHLDNTSNCYAPFFKPENSLTPLNADDVVPSRIPAEFWTNNPSTAWIAPPHQLIAKHHLMHCQTAVNWLNRSNPLNGGFVQATFHEINLVALSPRCAKYWRYQPTIFQYASLYSAAVANFGQDSYSSSVMFSGMDRTFLDFIMLSVPHAKFFVEFGTAAGITSVYLGISAKMRNGILHTFDIHDSRSEQSKLVWNDAFMVRHYEDILEAKKECRAFSCEAVNSATIEAVSKADIWLLDNGIKDKEAFLYAKFAPQGCIAVVHDMTMDPAQFELFNQPFLYHGYEPIYKAFSESLGAHLRAWRRVSDKAPSSILAKLKEPVQIHPAHSGVS
jgi:hypothetical protein